MSGNTRSAVRGLTVALALAAFVTLLAWLALGSLRPPEPVAADAPAAAFSAERAMPHVQAIAERRHPSGSAAHRSARDYIAGRLSELGLDVEIQRSEVVDRYGQRPDRERAASVENIVGRLEGSGGDGKALVLMAHYDSVAAGPGAADDAMGVAAILETLRALGQGQPLANDVIAVITDAEEAGLLGAQAFVREHRWTGDAGLVLNVEARGNRGPMIMFETSGGNAALIEALAEHAPSPWASSLTYAVYKRLPNDTDLSIVKGAGIAGMNFALVEGFYHYHTPGDAPDNLSRASLQHAGSYTLSLARHFGDIPLPVEASGDAVYFNVLGTALVSYSHAFAYLPASLGVVLFVAVIVTARRRRWLRYSDLAGGVAGVLVAIVFVGLAVTALHFLLGGGAGRATPELRAVFAVAERLLLAYLLIGAALVAGLYAVLYRGVGVWLGPIATATLLLLMLWAGALNMTSGIVTLVAGGLLTWSGRRPRSLWGLVTGALAVWTVLGAVLTVLLPDVSYLFVWPGLGIALALTVVALRGGDGALLDDGNVWIVAAGGIVTVVWLAMYVQFFHLSLGVRVPALPMALAVLGMGLLAPLLVYMARAARGVVPVMGVVAGVALVVTAAVSVPFDQQYGRPNEIFYLWNADAKSAHWASQLQARDEWMQHFLDGDADKHQWQPPAAPEVATDGEASDGQALWLADAPAVDIAEPAVEVLADEPAGEGRRLKLRIDAPTNTSELGIYVPAEARLREAKLGEQGLAAAQGGPWWRLRYIAPPPEGVELTLVTDAKEPLALRLMSVVWRWPQALAGKIPERPADSMRRPYSLSDATVVLKGVQLPLARPAD